MIEITTTQIKDDLQWKEFLKNQYNLFYDEKFLSYNDYFNKKIKWHHLKFRQKDSNKILAVVTGNESVINNEKVYVSCDGVSFGGFLWKSKLNSVDYIGILKEFKEYLKINGFRRCILRNPPFLFRKNQDEEYDYALLREGFTVSSFTITNIIDLKDFEFAKISETKKRTIRKSERNIEIILYDKLPNDDIMENYYSVLEKNRIQKNTRPTHSLEELKYLKNNLGNRISLFSAVIKDIIAGICVLFEVNSDVILNFYLANDESFMNQGVSEYLLFKTIEWSKKNSYKYYDIGTSDVNNRLNEGLFLFKKKYLANGYLRKTYEISL
ncbi:MAG: hypothetical protein FJ216_03890 [Ignavibacteria bacterium]|nr:hypothetical protein [Ignavibacteria bacterium]